MFYTVLCFVNGPKRKFTKDEEIYYQENKTKCEGVYLKDGWND